MADVAEIRAFIHGFTQSFYRRRHRILWNPVDPAYNYPDARDAASMRDRHNWFVLGRLALDATIDGARSNVDVILAELAEAHPQTNRGKKLLLTDGGRRLRIPLGSNSVTLATTISPRFLSLAASLG